MGEAIGYIIGALLGLIICLISEITLIKKENAELKLKLEALEGQTPWKDIKDKSELIKENAELRAIAENQQSSNMSRHFENKKLKEGLAVGSIFNKALNSMNKNLEEERDKYRNMVFDLQKENAELKDDNKVMADNYSKMEQKFYDNLTKAKEIIKRLLCVVRNHLRIADVSFNALINDAEKILKEE